MKNKNKKRAKKLDVKKIDGLEELERKLKFVAIKNRFLGRPNSFKEELKLKKITRKKINEMEKLETEIKEMKRLKIKATELKSSKLLSDLNIEKGLEIEEIKEIEIGLEKLKIPKTTVNTIRKLIIPEKYMHHILRLKRYCV